MISIDLVLKIWNLWSDLEIQLKRILPKECLFKIKQNVIILLGIISFSYKNDDFHILYFAVHMF